MVTTTATNPKCAGCGLVNFASASECKRCGASLGASTQSALSRARRNVRQSLSRSRSKTSKSSKKLSRSAGCSRASRGL